MILIADSGGTKTDWALVETSDSNPNVLCQFRSQGINPFHQSIDTIDGVVSNTLLPHINSLLNHEFDKDTFKHNVHKIFFYGAGCIGNSASLLRRVFSENFPHTEINIESDLMAAARSTLGHEPGVACILGTGSNSCVFNGEQIIDKIPPLGYVLGDEGSGAALGIMLLNAILKRRVPASLSEKFFIWINLTYEQIIDRVYKQPLANRFLGGLSKFVSNNIENEYLENLVIENFKNFFTNNILQYSSHSYNAISAVGGIASTFESQLYYCAQLYNWKVKKVLKSPIEALIEYHCL